MRYLTILATVLILTVSTTAHAKPKRDFDKGFYMSLKGGLNVMHDYTIGTRVSGVGVLKVENDVGYGFLGSAGYDFDTYRVEAEISSRANNVGTIARLETTKQQQGADGDASSLAFMVNGYYDLENESKYTPYVGGGIGYAYVEFEQYETNANPNILSDSGNAFAYQAMAGVEYELEERIGLTAEYRYFATGEIDVTTTLGNNTTELPYRNHSFLVGVNMKF